MPRKKSAKKSAEEFKLALEEISAFSEEVFGKQISAKHESWCYDLPILRLYREFERLMLNCIVAAIINDTSHLSKKKGFDFPKHLTDEVCEYIVVGDGYFDFRGRSGLIATLKRFLPDDHYLVEVVKEISFRDSLDRLSALRNFAAHDSQRSKEAAAQATGRARLGSAGSYLKSNGGQRFGKIVTDLERMANKIIQSAPY